MNELAIQIASLLHPQPKMNELELIQIVERTACFLHDEHKSRIYCLVSFDHGGQPPPIPHDHNYCASVVLRDKEGVPDPRIKTGVVSTTQVSPIFRGKTALHALEGLLLSLEHEQSRIQKVSTFVDWPVESRYMVNFRETDWETCDEEGNKIEESEFMKLARAVKAAHGL